MAHREKKWTTFNPFIKMLICDLESDSVKKGSVNEWSKNKQQRHESFTINIHLKRISPTNIFAIAYLHLFFTNVPINDFRIIQFFVRSFDFGEISKFFSNIFEKIISKCFLSEFSAKNAGKHIQTSTHVFAMSSFRNWRQGMFQRNNLILSEYKQWLNLVVYTKLTK